MLKSMTGYGRGSIVSTLGRFSVEIQSVNKKHLEVLVTLPPALMRFEQEIKRWIGEQVRRGRVQVSVTAEFDGISPVAVVPDVPLVRQLVAAWRQIYQELGFPADHPIDPQLLAGQEGLLTVREEESEDDALREGLQHATEEALHQLMAARQREGEALQADIEERCGNIAHWIDEISGKTAAAVAEYRKKLEARVKEFSSACADNEERILREICLYTDRIDIAEEITRFRSHVDHLDEVVRTAEGAAGKKVEFILQEMFRESNTIGAKMVDSEGARLVVSIKGDLERIREQVQNVE